MRHGRGSDSLTAATSGVSSLAKFLGVCCVFPPCWLGCARTLQPDSRGLTANLREEI